jgi:hypothetical protein
MIGCKACSSLLISRCDKAEPSDRYLCQCVELAAPSQNAVYSLYLSGASEVRMAGIARAMPNKGVKRGSLASSISRTVLEAMQ